MIKNCLNCNSEKVKESTTYRGMWFCKDCGQGDFINKSGSLMINNIEIKRRTPQSIVAEIVRDNPRDKVLIIGSGASLNIYEQVLYSKKIFTGKIDTNSMEYYDVSKTTDKIYLFSTNSPSRLESQNFYDLKFDHVILQELENREIDFFLYHLRLCYKTYACEKNAILHILGKKEYQ